jgi:phosphatidylglycerol:prolipoprotein diacylglycerol transferase
VISFFRDIFAPPRHLILLLAALWIGLMLAEKRAERHGISREAVNNLVFYGLLGYVLGGRLVFALANVSAFIQSPLSLLSINIDLFDPVAALAVAVIVAIVYGSRQNLPVWSILDALTPLFATIAIGLSLSHLAAGTAFGSPTALPWGIELWNATRHPTQVYELIASLLIFGIIWFRKYDPPAGSDFLLFVGLSAGARLFFETFRGDSYLILSGVRLAQVIAWVVLATAWITSEFLPDEKRVSE